MKNQDFIKRKRAYTTKNYEFKNFMPPYWERIQNSYSEYRNQTLDYWKKTHWDYYTHEMKKFNEYPSEEMEIVCEYFETIW